MESNTMPSEIAENGDNSPGCSLKSEVKIETDGASYRVWLGGKVIAGGSPSIDVSNVPPEADNIGQYMKSHVACEKDVNNSDPFPSLLESAEQERREKRNRETSGEFARRSFANMIQLE